MRLYEITTPLTPDKFEPKDIESAKDAEFGMDDQEFIGGGLFGNAFSTPQEPGTVRKVVGPRHKLDSYFHYVQFISKNERFTSNSYFPKIFDIQVKKFPDKRTHVTRYQYAYAVDMERLHEFNTLSQKEARMLGNRIFYNFDEIAVGKDARKNLGSDMDWKKALITLIGRVVEWGADRTSRYTTSIKDVQFKKAVMLLQGLHRKAWVGRNDPGGMGSMAFDLHKGNIMVRRGPGGPHLVITDPVV